MRIVLLAALFATSASVAAASGGLSCKAGDKAVSLSAEGGLTRGMGSALFSLSARVEIRDGAVADDLRVTEFAREHAPQYWLDADGLKLRLYREREEGPHGYVDVVVEAEPVGDEDGLEGEYRIEVYDMTGVEDGEARRATFSGAVSCFVE